MRMLIPLLSCLLASSSATAQSEAELRARLDAAVARADRLAAEGRGPATPRLDAIPEARSVGPVDVGALARRFEQVAREDAAQVLSPAGLLAFVSFSMPKSSLERLVRDAEATNTVLVLRGLVRDNLGETFRAVRALIGERQIGWVLDSEAFQRFDVQVAPTYVLLRPGAPQAGCDLGQCYGDADYLKLAGDVPIAYVLERFEREAGFAQAVASVRRRGGP